MDVVFNVSCHFRIDHTLFQARKSFTKAHELCQGLGLGNIWFWAYILQAFLQARAFDPGLVFIAAVVFEACSYGIKNFNH